MPANAADASATSHRYTGEYADSQTGLLHLRARDYDPQIGRFISMDEHPGANRIPLTLNKYLYGNADPVNTVDPSGNFGLGGMGAGMSSMANLATMAVRTLSIYNRASTAIDLIQFALSARDLVGAVTNMKELWGHLGKDPYTGSGTHGGQKYGIDLNEAMEQFAWNAPRAIAIASPEWGLRMAAPAYKVNKFVISMPVFNVVAAKADIPTGLRVRFKGKKVPVILQFGNSKKAEGGMMGIGVEDAKRRFMYRMDHHPAAPSHGGAAGKKANELAYWVDGSYHHHVMGWNQ